MAATKVLQTTTLGRNGPQITRLGYGAMGLSAFYGSVKPDQERLHFLDKLYESGERFWDTADMYADSEELLGTWFKQNPEKRQEIFLATKFAATKDESGNPTFKTDPAYAREACERSLQRLGLPSVDLYYIHRIDQVTPIEHTMQELVKLRSEGKFKYIGISECSAATLRRAHAVHPISALQVEYSPWALDIESEQIGLLKTARELGVAIVAYSPIGRGILSGLYRKPEDFAEGDFRRFAPRFSHENFPKNLVLVDKLGDMAKAKGCTASQLTLAWLMAQGDDIIPIPGTTNLERLSENLGALKVQLTKSEEQEIRKACMEAEVVGQRYPAAFESFCYADSVPLKA